MRSCEEGSRTSARIDMYSALPATPEPPALFSQYDLVFLPLDGPPELNPKLNGLGSAKVNGLGLVYVFRRFDTSSPCPLVIGA